MAQFIHKLAFIILKYSFINSTFSNKNPIEYLIDMAVNSSHWSQLRDTKWLEKHCSLNVTFFVFIDLGNTLVKTDATPCAFQRRLFAKNIHTPTSLESPHDGYILRKCDLKKHSPASAPVT